MECGNIKPRGGPSCTVDGPPQSLRFKLTSYTFCNDSIHSQQQQHGILDECLDLSCNNSTPTLENVQISCFSHVDGTWDAFQSQLVVGDTWTLRANRGYALPEQVTCRLSTSGTPVQSVTVNLDQDLFLQDSFGSLLLEACDDFDCQVPVTYEYTVLNAGESAEITVTTWERERQDKVLDLLELPTATSVIISPNQTGSLLETEVINACRDAEIATTVSVKAVASSMGLPCSATTLHSFEINVPCRVHVEILCTNDDGISCHGMETPARACATTSIEVLRFTYQESTCAASLLTHRQPDPYCQDLAPLPDGPASITCELLLPAARS